ncbi:MAG: hypothetical protein DRJ15_12610 [Bacteroidetes bacterium]|nr:MAG: hypothetical protein DRJ15_12610 [Bacteroidota bacterium]
MKVQEILLERQRKIKFKSNIGRIPIIPLPNGSNFVTSKIKNYLNRGTMAQAFEHPTSPNTVIKVIDITLGAQPDGQVINTNMILEHQDNPFFPKIYKAIIFKHYNPGGAHKLYIEMEKLHEMTKKKLRHNHEAILHSMGLDPSLIGGESDVHGDDENKHLYALEEIMHLLTVPENIPADFITKIKNPQFVQAIDILRKTKHDHNASYDLHSGNYMYRMTSVGPQLVIIDPFV